MSGRASLTLGGLGLFAVAVSVLFMVRPALPAAGPAEPPALPLTIAASEVGDFGSGYSWYLSVNSAGQAELTICKVREWTRRRFEVSKERLAEFRKALADQRFFELAEEYGEHVLCGSTSSLTVTEGETSRTVRVRFLMNWVHSDRRKLRDPARAVRLLVLIRGWFDDADAVDLRKYDRMVLDAVK